MTKKNEEAKETKKKLIWDEDNFLSKGGHPMINKLLAEMSALHVSKNSDYSGGSEVDLNSFFSNFKSCADINVEPWIAAFCRVTDKFSRAKTIIKNEGRMEIDEPIKETLIDLSLCSLITLILYEESVNK